MRSVVTHFFEQQT